MTEMKEESWWKDTEWVPIANKPFSFFKKGWEKKKKRKEKAKGKQSNRALGGKKLEEIRR